MGKKQNTFQILEIFKISIGYPLFIVCLFGIFGKIAPYSIPRLLSFGYPLSFGTFLTWILMALTFKVVMNSENDISYINTKHPDQKTKKSKMTFKFDFVFIFSTIVIAASVFTFQINTTVESEYQILASSYNDHIFFSLFMQGIGLFLGIIMAFIMIFGEPKTENDSKNHQDIQKQKTSLKKDANQQRDLTSFKMFIFNPFLKCRSSFPLEILLGATTGGLFGLYFALLFYPHPGNIYSSIVSPLFSLESDPFALVLFLLVLIVFFIYPRIDIISLIGMALAWLAMGLTAIHFWSINELSIAAGITLDKMTTSLLSYSFVIIGIAWGGFRGYQVWQWRLQ